MDLRKAEVNAWLDSKCLLPGQNWKREIRRLIGESARFLLLISKDSVNKRGYVQAEIKQALRVWDEIPSNEIFIIPARLDSTKPADDELHDLNWIDLFPSYRKGVQRILQGLASLQKEPLTLSSEVSSHSSRSPIGYTPYRSFDELAQSILERLPESTVFADTDVPYHLTFKTNRADVDIPDFLRDQYPERITVALQNQYFDFVAKSSFFEVRLFFSGKPAALRVPYAALLEISIPTLGVFIHNAKA